jgi:hypothetical protein
MEQVLQHEKQSSRRGGNLADAAREAASPQHLGARLQEQAGNLAMQHLLRGGVIRAKLAVSPAGDTDEQEAEQASGRIMRSYAGAGAATTSCSCGDDEENMCDECRQKHAAIARKPSGASAPHSPSAAVVSQMLRSPGHPLDHATRSFFEPRLGRDVSHVRVHTDSDAAESASALRAHAYTLGNDIWFGAGKYSPSTDDGKHLLAHEIAHTFQQQSAPDASGTLRRDAVTVGRVDDPMEAEADHVASAVMRSSVSRAAVSADNTLAVRGAWYSPGVDAAEWLGGKVVSAGESAYDAGKWVGGKAVDAAGAVKDWAVGKAEKGVECAQSMGKGAWNLVTGNISSLSDVLGIEAPAEEGPGMLDTLLTVLKHPCLQMLPGYGLVAGAVGLLESAGKFLEGAWKLIQNPQPVIDGIHDAIGKMIDGIPAYVSGLVQKALSAAGSKLKEYGEGVWRHLEPKLEYLAKNWWQVIKETGGQLLWPWPSVGKDLGDIWHHLKAAGDHLWNMRFSKALDEILAVSRGVNSIAGALYGWFFIASVLVGTIIGAFFGGAGAIPGFWAGVGFAGEVGEGLLIATVGIESASIAKAIFNLVAQRETKEEKEADYEQIASSSLTLAITGVMFVLSELAVRFAKGLLSKVAGLFRKAGAEGLEDTASAAAKTATGEAPKVEGPKADAKADAPKVEGTPERPPAPDPDAAAKVKAEDLSKLRDEVHDPNNVHAPDDPRLAGKYDAEVDFDGHRYMRDAADGSWCRFSEPVCGIDLPEVKADVDTALLPKPEELPPEIAAETPEPNSPEAVTTEATPEKATPEAKSTELKPGSPEHKAARWKEYQARGGKWKYERWSNVYEKNMVRAKLASAAESAYQKQLGWGELTGNQPGPMVEGVERRFDITDKLTRRGVEVKTGKMYLTQQIAWEILRDKILVEQGWDVEWHFDTEPSGPLRRALADAKVEVTVGSPSLPVAPAVPVVAP